MNDEITIDSVNVALRRWAFLVTQENRSFNKKSILNFLHSGFCMRITYDDFLFWKDRIPLLAVESATIHVYLGIFGDEGINEELKFVCIDSNSDLYPQSNMDNIKVLDFIRPVIYSEFMQTDTQQRESGATEFQPVNGERRNYLWNLFSGAWMEQMCSPEIESFVQVICIPFLDLQLLFDKNQNPVIAFLALNDEDNPLLPSIEFIVAKEMVAYNLTNEYYDISYPVPPYQIGISPDGFKLLPHS